MNRDQVNMFCLKLDKGGFIFMRVPLINANEFFQVISKGSKYSCYKLYKNVFVKANQKTTTGYMPDGKNYDEYKDVDTYYMWMKQSRNGRFLNPQRNRSEKR